MGRGLSHGLLIYMGCLLPLTSFPLIVIFLPLFLAGQYWHMITSQNSKILLVYIIVVPDFSSEQVHPGFEETKK